MTNRPAGDHDTKGDLLVRSERTGAGVERSSWLLVCRRPIISGLAALAIVVPGAAALSPTAAQAATVPLTHSLPRGSNHSDQTWGGYAVTGKKPYTKITGSWKIPAMKCAGYRGDASPWIGIDGWRSFTVEQIGIDLDCRSGVGSYHLWVEMYPEGSDYFAETVHAGDTLTASVSVSGNVWTLTESDITAGWTRTFHRKPKFTTQKSSAEAIVEDVGNRAVPNVPDFGTVMFSNITVDGSPLQSAGTPHQTTVERGNTPLSHEGPLSGGTYSISWLHE